MQPLTCRLLLLFLLLAMPFTAQSLHPTIEIDPIQAISQRPPVSISEHSTIVEQQAEFIRQAMRIDQRLSRDPDMQNALNNDFNHTIESSYTISEHYDHNNHLIQRPTLTAAKEQELRFYAALTAAAYCYRRSIFPKWKCGYPRCQSSAKRRTAEEDILSQMRIHSYLSQDGVVGYAATNPRMPNHVFIIYRGSLVVENFVNDLMVAQADYSFPDVPPLAKVHKGFYRTWLSIRGQTLAAIHSILPTVAAASGNQSVQIVLAGHSLGGACAVIGGLELRRRLRARQYPFTSSTATENVRFRFYTYGEPRLGNTVFANWLASLAAEDDFPIHRTTYYDDLVTRLPPRRFPGRLSHLQFYHHTSEFHILANRSATVVCGDRDSGNAMQFQPSTGAADDTQYDGHYNAEDPLCSSGVPRYNIFSHLTYYDIIYGPWC